MKDDLVQWAVELCNSSECRGDIVAGILRHLMT